MVAEKKGVSAYDHLVKILLIGDSGVGKSCLLQRYSDNDFNASFITTIGIDFKIRTIELDNKKIKLQIWDTAGQERFRSITTAYYRSARGILLVYDITDERSFNNLEKWLSSIESFAGPDVCVLVVGNKCDCEDRRSVTRAADFSRKRNLKYMETSAKCGDNVAEVFATLTREVLKSMQTEVRESAKNTVDVTPKAKKQDKCC